MIDAQARMRRLMSCLGDPSRFQLVRHLVRGERCVSDLARVVGLSQSCTTRHLQALQREQIVRGERAGKRVLFHLCLEEPQVGELLTWAMSARAGRAPAPRVRRSRLMQGADVHHDRPAAASRREAPPAAEPAPDPIPRRPHRDDLEDYLL